MDQPGGSGEDLVKPEVKKLPPQEQLAQLVSYIEAAYEDSPNYLALLPDRITHAAMMMLGSAVDHTMPGTAYAQDVEFEEAEFGVIFNPGKPLVVAVAELPDSAREHAWRPEVAACAALADLSLYDVSSPADAALIPADAYWGFQSACALLPEAEKHLLTFPTALPSKSARTTCVQRASEMPALSAPGAEVLEYFSTGLISTPEEARRRIRDAAVFLGA